MKKKDRSDRRKAAPLSAPKSSAAVPVAAAALRESEERYRRLVNAVTDYLFTVHVEEGRAVATHHGEGCVGVTGFTTEEYRADPLLWLRMVHEEDREKVLDQARRILADEPVGALEHRIVHKSGAVRWVRNTPVPHHDQEGRLVAFDGLVADITERRRAEQSLRSREEEFRSLFENSPSSLWIEDLSGIKRRLDELRAGGMQDLAAYLDGHPEELQRCAGLVRVLDVNRATVALFRAQDKETLLAGVERTFTPETFATFRQGLGSIAEGKDSCHAETTYRTLDGEPIHVLVSWSVIPGAAEPYAKVVVAITDITEHKRQEDLLRRIADELLVKTGDEYFAALAGFVARELGTEYAFIGQIAGAGRCVRTIAVSSHGQAGENFTFDLAGTPCDTVMGVAARFYPAGVRGLFPRDELLVEMQVESYAGIPLFASDGRPLGIFVTMSNRPLAIADRDRILPLLRVFSARAAAELERREAEDSLRTSEEFVKSIVDSVDEAFLVIGRDYRILSCNRAYSAQTGLDPGDCIGRFCYEVSHGKSASCWESGEDCAVRRTFTTGEPGRAIHEHHDAHGGAIRVETKSFPLRDAAGAVAGAIEIINNITDRLRLEEQLRQAQKMEAVGLLAGGVAHDFNNILSAIIGYGNLLELKLPPDSAGRTYVEQILSAAERAAHLTQSLLAFSRKQIISPRALDLNEVIRRIEKLLVRVMGEDIELAAHLAERRLTVFADGGQIEQIIMNLATNARDAMPAGGIFNLETSPFSMTDAFVRAHGYGRPGEYALLVVSDTGHGMDERVRARLFEPFFTTKELGRGTGLGLAMVYGAIQQNGGHITVYSEPGQGTMFRIYLPLIPDEEKVAPALPQPMIRGTGTILLAEDDEVVRRLSSAVLREFGYTVIEAVDGEDALAQFGEQGDAVDLCIFDVVMPRMNGKEAYHQLRQRRPGLKVLFISGYTADIMHKKGILDPGLNFLSKPISPQGLLAKVHEILHGA